MRILVKQNLKTKKKEKKKKKKELLFGPVPSTATEGTSTLVILTIAFFFIVQNLS